MIPKVFHCAYDSNFIMKQILIISFVLTISVTLTLIFIHTNANAWHENLGIDANKAAELYQTKPNDPAIVK